MLYKLRTQSVKKIEDRIQKWGSSMIGADRIYENKNGKCETVRNRFNEYVIEMSHTSRDFGVIERTCAKNKGASEHTTLKKLLRFIIKKGINFASQNLLVPSVND